MALQVWLPLNGNLENLGLGTVSQTNDTEPIYKEYGKLGNQSIDLATRVQFDCPEMANTQQWTVAFWGRVENKEDATTNWQDLWGFTDVRASDGTNGTFRFETGYASDAQAGVHFHDNNTCATTGRAYTFNRIEARNEWHHYAVSVSDTEIKAYYDGELVDTSDSVNGGSWNTNGRFYIGQTNALNGCMQDLRLWDEPISALEIKKISQGLILHLSLDRDGLGQSNLILNSQLQSSTDDWVVGGAGADNCNLTVKDGFQCMHVAGELGATAYLSPKYTIEADNAGFVPYNGMTITMSADVLLENVTKGTTNYFLAFYGSGQTIDGHWRGVSIVSCSEHFTIVSMPSAIVGTAIVGAAMLSADGYISAKSSTFDPDKLNGVGWVRASVTFRYGDYAWTAHLRPNIYCRDFTGDFYVKNVKVEYGDKATPWCPNEADDLYTAYHCDDVIHDTSGYQYNGTRYGTLSYDSDSPRYNTSTYFNGSSDIRTEKGSFGWFDFKEGTISAWYNPANTTQTWASVGVQSDNGQGSRSFSVCNYSGKAATVVGYDTSWGNVSSSFSMEANTWYHLCATITNGDTVKLYVNGELVQTRTVTNTTGTIASNTQFAIGVDLPGGDEHFTGKMSDVRFYTTCLNELDVRELYNTSMSLSDNGLLFGYEFIG